MDYIVTVTSKRQITFPKKLFDELGIEKGDKLVIKKKGKKATIEPRKPKGRGILNLVGKFGELHVPKGKTVDDLIHESTLEMAKDALS